MALLLPYLPEPSILPSGPAPEPFAPYGAHPRLWLTAADLPRLRSWAVDSNPMYREGLAQVAARAKQDMDSGRVAGKDGGTTTWTEYPSEMYAELFAFMSLLGTDPAERNDYARRARTLLMYVMERASRGQAKD